MQMNSTAQRISDAARSARKNQKEQAEKEQFLSEFKRNNPEASLKEAEKAFKADKKEKAEAKKNEAANTAAQAMLILRNGTP